MPHEFCQYLIAEDDGKSCEDDASSYAMTVIQLRDVSGLRAIESCKNIGVPYGSRTRVAAVKGRCPRPLDERDAS